MLFDWLAVGRDVPVNPASSARAAKYMMKTGETTVRTAENGSDRCSAVQSTPRGTCAAVRFQ